MKEEFTNLRNVDCQFFFMREQFSYVGSYSSSSYFDEFSIRVLRVEVDGFTVSARVPCMLRMRNTTSSEYAE